MVSNCKAYGRCYASNARLVPREFLGDVVESSLGGGVVPAVGVPIGLLFEPRGATVLGLVGQGEKEFELVDGTAGLIELAGKESWGILRASRCRSGWSRVPPGLPGFVPNRDYALGPSSVSTLRYYASELLQVHDRLMIIEALNRYAWGYDSRDLESRSTS